MPTLFDPGTTPGVVVDVENRACGVGGVVDVAQPDVGLGEGHLGLVSGDGDRVGRVVVDDVDADAFDEGGGDGVDGVLGGDPAAATGRGGPGAVVLEEQTGDRRRWRHGAFDRGGERRDVQRPVGGQRATAGEGGGRRDRRRLVRLEVEGRCCATSTPVCGVGWCCRRCRARHRFWSGRGRLCIRWVSRRPTCRPCVESPCRWLGARAAIAVRSESSGCLAASPATSPVT